ncbi:MAG TPA: hypothetical protein VF282_01570 [Bacillota bacterium]
MDWPRAKTILIIALVALNAFLYHEASVRRVLPVPEATYLTAVPVGPILEELAAYGVEADIPGDMPPRLPALRLLPRPQAIAPETLFADGQAVEIGQGTVGPCTGTVYTGETHKLCVSEDGWIFYALTERVDRERATPADLTEARAQVDALFEAMGGVSADLVGPDTTFDRRGRTFRFRYEQVIEDAAAGVLWIFPGIVEIHATGEQVVSYRQRLWDIRTGDSAPEPVMPITNLMQRQFEDRDRLVDLLDRYAGEAAGNPVMRVRLGYALGPRLAPGAGVEPAGTVAYEGRPAWQILLEGAPPLLFDAYTGEPIEAAGP